MSDDRIAVDIRDAFDGTYEPNPGLEDRVIAAIPWEAPRRRSFSRPRLAGAFAGALAVVTIMALLAPTILSRLNITLPGAIPSTEAPAYSLASVTGGSVFIVQRGLTRPGNILLQSRDGGRTWTSRLGFAGVYDGMQMFGQDGYIWSFDLGGSNCGVLDSSCQPKPPTNALALYRTRDGGATWTALPDSGLRVNGVYFADASHGWIDSGSPDTGLNGDVLYATHDGGLSWSRIGGLPMAPMAWVYGVGQYHVTFSDPKHGWWLGDGQLFTTTDGGHTWSLFGGLHRLAGTTSTYYQPVFSGQDGILPVAGRAVSPDNATANVLSFFVTNDGGATWSIQPRTSPAGFAPVGDILSITILNTQHFWLTSQSLTGGDNVQASPAVARTSDGGLTWTVTHHTPRILQMSFRDTTHGFALDVTGPQNINGILSTSDAGATWQRVSVPVFG